MPTVSMNVNGKAVSGEVENRTLLVQFLRDSLRLTGTHVGCDTSQCGACCVTLNGASIKSCTMLAVQAEGAEVTTIEGLAQDGGRAFKLLGHDECLNLLIQLQHPIRHPPLAGR